MKTSESSVEPHPIAPPYRREEVAQILKMSPSQVSKLIRSGRLRAVRTGFGSLRQHCRVSHEALMEFLAQSGTATSDKEVR